MNPILTIAIATYNRCAYIGETLDSIIPQLTEEVDVLVVDGASTDDTQHLMGVYLQRCSRIRYIRLPSKGGIDKDYDIAVQQASGDYCWLFPDDDVLKPGAVDSVLRRIREHHDLIIVNAEVRNVDLSTLIEEKRLTISRDLIYAPSDAEKFFVDTAIYMTYIGCVVIRRERWLEREREHYYGTEFIHVGVIFQTLLPSSVAVIAEPYISIRLGNAQWTARAFEIWVFKWPTLIWSFDQFTSASKRRVYPKEPWRSVTRLLFIRAEGNYGIGEYRRFIRARLSSVAERALIMSIALVPGVLVNFAAVVYYSIDASKNKYALSVLRSSRYSIFK